jgi:hypothetical protein
MTARAPRRTPRRTLSRSLAGALCLALLGCTAGGDADVVAAFPPGVEVTEVLFRASDHHSCTFAETAIRPEVTIDPAALAATSRALAALDPGRPFQRFAFPAGGFAYFPDRSVLEVADLLAARGDEDLGEDIFRHIAYAKRCFRSKLEETLKADQRLAEDDRYFKVITDTPGTVVIASAPPHTTLLLLPGQGRAYYLGP